MESRKDRTALWSGLALELHKRDGFAREPAVPTELGKATLIQEPGNATEHLPPSRPVSDGAVDTIELVEVPRASPYAVPAETRLGGVRPAPGLVSFHHEEQVNHYREMSLVEFVEPVELLRHRLYLPGPEDKDVPKRFFIPEEDLYILLLRDALSEDLRPVESEVPDAQQMPLLPVFDNLVVESALRLATRVHLDIKVVPVVESLLEGGAPYQENGLGVRLRDEHPASDSSQNLLD